MVVAKVPCKGVLKLNRERENEGWGEGGLLQVCSLTGCHAATKSNVNFSIWCSLLKGRRCENVCHSTCGLVIWVEFNVHLYSVYSDGAPRYLQGLSALLRMHAPTVGEESSLIRYDTRETTVVRWNSKQVANSDVLLTMDFVNKKS